MVNRMLDDSGALRAVTSRRRRPVLVTGVPRSGTTWLARQLAGAPGCAMTGREPMNPQPGQYRLGGTLDAWTRLRAPSRRQLAALRLAYAGLTPRVYGKYGHRQWAAPWPGTTTVVKDPFAVLSVDTVVRVTSALPVLVYRHPAAVLASYRRMGWSPDVAEVSVAVADEEGLPAAPAGASDSAASMAWFWSTLNSVALQDLAAVEGGVVVSHEELASGGAHALGVLYDACGLARPARAASGTGQSAATRSAPEGAGASTRVLHRLDRPSGEVAGAWRSSTDPDELEVLDAIAGATFDALEATRLRLS
jgi:Sulfotransferase family